MRASPLIVLALVALAALPGWGCGGSGGPVAGPPYEAPEIPPFLIYLSENDIWGMRANGDSLARYTLNPAGSIQFPAAMSHDGLEIVFAYKEDSGEPGDPSIWIMDFGGGNRRRLGADIGGDFVYGHTATFTADDSGILVGRIDTGAVALYDRASGAFTSFVMTGFHPSSSPDGSRVALHTTGLCAGYGIGAVDMADTSVALPLCGLDLDLCSPVWAPDGAQIAFDNDPSLGGGGNPVTDIYVTAYPPAAGPSVASTRLTNFGNAHHPSFSPSGQLLAFQRGNDIWVMNADGTEPENLTNGEIVAEYPRFAGSP